MELDGLVLTRPNPSTYEHLIHIFILVAAAATAFLVFSVHNHEEDKCHQSEYKKHVLICHLLIAEK
jgi:hypothetical protein